MKLTKEILDRVVASVMKHREEFGDAEVFMCDVQGGIVAAYTHTQYEVMMTNAAVITSTGDKAKWAPGYIPHIVRAWAFVVTVAVGADAAQLNLDKRITAGSDTGRINDLVSPLNLIATLAAGNVIYKDGLQAKVSPGEELVFEVTDASAAGTGSVVIFVEPAWEVPANNTKMALTT